MLEFRVLGTLELLSSDGTPVLSVLSQPKRAALLAYLALATPRGFQRRDTLLALFWPEADETRARRSLNQALYHLRHSLGEDVIASRSAEEAGLEWSRIRCDAVEFREAIRDGRPEAALELYRGELLSGFHADASPEFEQWLDAERASFRAAAAAAASGLAARAEAAGDLAAAADHLRRARGIEPEREQHVQRLVDVLDRLGESATALREYEIFAARLAADFDTAPSTALAEAAERLRRAPPPASQPAATSTVQTLPSAAPPVQRIRARALAATALVIAAIGITLALLAKPDRSAPPEAASLGVLPMKALSAGIEDFADGLTAELIGTLGQVPRLRVPGPASSLHYKGRNVPPSQIAAELDVGLVLEGDVREDGGRIVVGIRLTNPATGRRLWSLSREYGTTQRLELQQRIAREVGALLTFAAPGWPEHVADSAVYDAYVQALLASDPAPEQQGTPASAAQVPQLEQYRRIVEHAPDFAPARAGMAYALNRAGEFDEALRQADAALAMDSTLVLARAARASTLAWGQWQWEQAERELDRAIELAPWWGRLYHHRANIRYRRGNLQLALEDFRRAELLDPFSDAVLSDKAGLLAAAGRYAQALELLDRITRTDTTDLVKLTLAPVLQWVGRRSEAAALYRSLRAPRMAIVASGDTAELRALLRQDLPPCLRGMAWFELGVDEPMLECLEDSVAKHHRWATEGLRTEYFAERLRTHPRFQRLLEQVYGTR